MLTLLDVFQSLMNNMVKLVTGFDGLCERDWLRTANRENS